MRAVLRELALRHAPAKVVDAGNAAEVAGEVAGEGRSFKRCKEYLLAHYADRLPQSLRERLTEQIDFVPRGVTPHAEATIQRELSRLEQERGRFDVAEVDYVAAVRALGTEHERDSQSRMESARGANRSLSSGYVRNLIAKTASDTTGEDVDALLRAGRLTIGPRDAIEFIVRVEALFDCTLGRMRYQSLSIEIDLLAQEVLVATGTGTEPYKGRPV